MKIHILSQTMAEYELFPRVALLGKEIEYTVKGLGIEAALLPGREYVIRIIPQEEIATARTLAIGDENCYRELRAVTDLSGVLCFSLRLEREQGYLFRLLLAEEETLTRIVDFRVFGAAQDLWERIPMRGNTHCHACHSVDGHEDPAIAASVYRKAGFDYLAITDHHKTDGSVYAIHALAQIPHEMALYYGEEVHVPNAYIHNVNVGALMEGNVGLDAYYHAHEAEVQAQVDAIVQQDGPGLPEGIQPYDWAWRKWICDTIHRQGGIAILAHPCWLYDAHNTSDAMIAYAAQKGLYDAIEVLMGQEPGSSESNMQIALWNELRANGIFITPIGCDDAHRRSYAWNYDSSFNQAATVLFAKAPDFSGFAEAIRGGYAVAVDNFDGAPNHVIGSYRMTKFAIFLLEQYFPLHDELCFEEGCRMKDAYLGDEEAKKVLELLCGRVKRFTDRFYGRAQVL